MSSTMYVTSSVPSNAQVSKLLKFLECNKWLTTSQARTAAARDRSRAAWQFITARLNNTTGCKKSWQQWSKYWKDKKSMVKKKAMQQSKRPESDIVGSEIEMSQTDQRVYAIIQIEMAKKGRARSSHNEETDTKAYTLQIDEDEEMEPEKPQVFSHQLLADEQMTEYDTNDRLMEDTDRNSSPEQDPLPAVGDPTLGDEDIGNTTPSRRKNSRMEQLTERFLKIEERRVEIEYTDAKSREKLANALEQMSQAWRQQSDALVSVAESLKVMVSKINTNYNS